MLATNEHFAVELKPTKDMPLFWWMNRSDGFYIDNQSMICNLVVHHLSKFNISAELIAAQLVHI